MAKWEAWVERMADVFVVLVRNHKTSYGLVAFPTRNDAERQAAKINKYPIGKKLELYKEAMRKNMVCKKHEELSFESTQLKLIDIEKGEACYGITVWIEGAKYIVAKKKYKKDVAELLKQWKEEHTEQEIVEFFRTKVRARNRERIHSLVQQ